MKQYAELRGLIRAKFGTQAEYAKALGISEPTLSGRLSGASDFTESEIKITRDLCELNTAELDKYFFTN